MSNFFPVLEQLLTSDAITGNPHFMVLIAKIFYMSIQVSILFDYAQKKRQKLLY